MDAPPLSSVLAPPLSADLERVGWPPVHPHDASGGVGQHSYATLNTSRGGSAGRPTSTSSRYQQRPPQHPDFSRIEIETVLGEKMHADANVGRPHSSGPPGSRLSRKNQELMTAVKDSMDSFRPGTNARTRFKKTSAYQHMGFALETTDRKLASYNGACWSGASGAYGRAGPRQRPHTSGAARTTAALPDLTSSLEEAENVTQHYLKEFVKASVKAEQAVKECPYARKWHASLGGGSPPRGAGQFSAGDGDDGDVTFNDGGGGGGGAREVFLEHIVARQERKQAAEYERVRCANPADNPAALQGMFTEFQKFCEDIKQRAVDAGREEDAAAVDKPDVQKTLLERFLDYNLETAKGAVEHEGVGQGGPAGSPTAAASPRTFSGLPAAHPRAAQQQAAKPNARRRKEMKGERVKKLHRPKTAPAAPAPTTAPVQSTESRLAMLMHAPAKSQYHEHLLRKQAAVLLARQQQAMAHAQAYAGAPPHGAAASSAGPVSPAAGGMHINIDGSGETVPMGAAGGVGDAENVGAGAASPSTGVTGGVVDVGSGDEGGMASPQVQRATPDVAVPQAPAPAPPSSRDAAVTQEALLAQMQHHTAAHFRSLQRQQVRHQERSRLLFNRAPTSVRKKIIDRRYRRVLGDDGMGQSACLLFMPKPGEVPAVPPHGFQ